MATTKDSRKSASATNKKKPITLTELKDQYLGERGTKKRELYELELSLELLTEILRTVRKKRNITQDELGKKVGVGKAQISKLEKHATNATIGTIVKVLEALDTKVTLKIEIENKEEALELA